MIKRLFSRTGLIINDIVFESGINLVLGKYSGEREAKGINGIGKSSFVRLINYSLLSDTAEKTFNQPKYDFLRDEEHSIALEFEIKDKIYFIERRFDDNQTVYFGNSLVGLEEYTRSDLIEILSSKLFTVEDESVFIEGNRFRTIMQFFVKDDLQNQERIDPTDFFSFTIGSIDKNNYNFFLMNLPTKTIYNFGEVAKEYNQYKTTIKGLTEKVKADTGKSIEEFRSEKLKLETSIASIRDSLKKYNFIESHKELEIKLTQLISNINNKTLEYHETNQSLKKVRESYQQSHEIDTKQVEKIYNEVTSQFGNQIKKTLDEMKIFKAEILENRNRFLVKKENELEFSIDRIFKELSKLENERSEIFSTLREKGALDKIEKTYEKLVDEQSSLERNTQILQQIDDINKIQSENEVILSGLKRDISNEIANHERDLNELRRIFQEILKNAIFFEDNDGTGYFDVSTLSNSKKTSLPFKIDVQIPKADALGQERLKIIAYDLMIFLTAMNQSRSIPNFLFHDGVYHGIAHRTRVNVLNFIYHKHLTLYKKRNFQYIATFNEDEIEIPDGKEETYGKFDFDWKKHLILELADTKEKMLFKRNFE